MNAFIDTRGNVAEPLTFCEAIVQGIAPGGGLFVPQEIPALPLDEICGLAELPYAERDALMAGAYGP